MSTSDFWSRNELSSYMGILRRLEKAKSDRAERAKERLESGFYLSDDVARATAKNMLDDAD